PHRLDGAVLREQLAHLGVSGGKRQVAHIDLRHAIELLKQTLLAGVLTEDRLSRRGTHCHLVENDSAFQTRKPTRKRGGWQAAGKGKVTNRRGRYRRGRFRHKRAARICHNTAPGSRPGRSGSPL